MGHGHVIPNADGSKARCGGPSICMECAAERAQAVEKLKATMDEKINKPIFLDMKKAEEDNINWPGTFIYIDYTNYRGERATRRIRPISFRVGRSEWWHPHIQKLMLAYDLDKGFEREFAVDGIHSWGVPPADPA